ncbi:DUF4148 domain-containing protein [Pseudoduganella sp. UC29_106]|uniref:DUF4148 domain-containing protein n=1 Tax=Pseudoduganella sp. UC29_106 TaxID=3374553 RepID=UPI0037576CA5
MKSTQAALAALFVAATGSALAAPAASVDMPTVAITAGTFTGPNSGEGYQGYTSFVSTKTRAQVRQELMDALRNGEIFAGEAYPGPIVGLH